MRLSFEAAVLLNDGNVPAIELPHLRVALFYDLFAARNVEKARAFFVTFRFRRRRGMLMMCCRV